MSEHSRGVVELVRGAAQLPLMPRCGVLVRMCCLLGYSRRADVANFTGKFDPEPTCCRAHRVTGRTRGKAIVDSLFANTMLMHSAAWVAGATGARRMNFLPG